MSKYANSNSMRKSTIETGSAYEYQLSRKSNPSKEPSTIFPMNKLLAGELNIHERRVEFQRYLELFGYKPESTILQFHISGFFNKSQPSDKEIEKRKESFQRYGGTTFVIVGRTHDPSIVHNLISPKKRILIKEVLVI